MSRVPLPVALDFETWGIEGRPSYPPIPCGVSILYPGKKPHYYAWGHAEGNTCTLSDGIDAVRAAYAHPGGILCQNAKFDIDVANVHLGLPLPEWQRVHDSLFLLYLDDPHQAELGLKQSAERLLGMKPEERDEVVDWLVAHQPVPGIKISTSKSSPTYAMKYVPFAPAALVATYANGDTDRTMRLFTHLLPSITTRGMLEAYDRERQLMPILLDMERQGIPVDVTRLTRDVVSYHTWLTKINHWIVTTLKADPSINLDSGEQLMKAMIAAKKVDVTKVPKTPTGKYQTNKDALLSSVTDEVLLAILKYRTQLSTCLKTFMQPWLATAQLSDGFIFTTWNQTKVPSGDANVGTRTGRLSSTPNFQNIPKEFYPIFDHEKRGLTKCPPFLRGLPSLPMIRSYITPFPGEVLIDRDYSQQEPRILAHFDGGSLMQKYLNEPWIDFHDYAKAELAKMNLFYERKPVKNTNLGLIYGMGVGKLAMKNNMTVKEAGILKKAILKLYPGLKDMYYDMKVRAANKEPIRTWGGREYSCEEPKLIDGHFRQMDYKLVNVLIQGSAADCTKEAIIRFYTQKDKRWKLMLNVHDELVASVPRRDVTKAMDVMQQAMESVQFDVAMLTEGTTSEKNWHALAPYDVKGVRVQKKVT